ncbi:TylF/MycF/NovP-related O-methyltransferase [Paracraurococcus ruber]|nr:TylF/MycF/NovP-related O-methyltransferase [Paracraurococcus ruber]
MLKPLKRAVLLAMLSPLARSVMRERLTMLGARKMLRLERAATTLRRRGVAGDFVEFGLALGGSGILLARHARRDGRQFHGFDVFGMIPPPTSEKDDATSKARYEEIAAGKSKGIGDDIYYGYLPNLFDVVSGSFARHGVPVDGQAVVLHKGLFEETLPHYANRPVALAHVDCDWYDPAKLVLTTLADRVPSGGVIIMDDYHAYGGARTATEEFLRERDDYALEDGDNVILRRR